VAKGERGKRQRVKQTEFIREKESLCCVHFCLLSFHHFRSLPIAIVAAIVPHRCSDVKRAKVVIFSQNDGFLIMPKSMEVSLSKIFANQSQRLVSASLITD